MASRYILKVWQQARAGNAEAQVTLAEAYLRGQEGMGRNPAAARRWLETATRLGCPRAEDLLSQHFPSGKLPAPQPQGVRLLLPENCWRDAGGERWLNTLLSGQKPTRPDNWETRLAMQKRADSGLPGSFCSRWQENNLPVSAERGICSACP